MFTILYYFYMCNKKKLISAGPLGATRLLRPSHISCSLQPCSIAILQQAVHVVPTACWLGSCRLRVSKLFDWFPSCLVPPVDQKITFQTGSFKDDTVTYQNNTGQTVKLDILERAILTIPGLSES